MNLPNIARQFALVGSALLVPGCATEVYTEHYIGVYDVDQQVTQELYRIKIKGHAQWASDVQYASGWVPAPAADLLAAKVDLEKNGDVTISGSPGAGSILPPTRRYYEMGPLGVTQAPQEGRFVIVMNSNPDEFFRKAATLTRFYAGQNAADPARERLMRDISNERLSNLNEITKVQEQIDKLNGSSK